MPFERNRQIFGGKFDMHYSPMRGRGCRGRGMKNEWSKYENRAPLYQATTCRRTGAPVIDFSGRQSARAM